jgi:hypothetical protein
VNIYAHLNDPTTTRVPVDPHRSGITRSGVDLMTKRLTHIILRNATSRHLAFGVIAVPDHAPATFMRNGIVFSGLPPTVINTA